MLIRTLMTFASVRQTCTCSLGVHVNSIVVSSIISLCVMNCFIFQIDKDLLDKLFQTMFCKSTYIVNRTLVQRAYNLCDPDSLQKELRHIKTTLQRNGYNPSKINTSTCLPYFGSTSHQLQCILQQTGIKAYHSGPNKLQ